MEAGMSVEGPRHIIRDRSGVTPADLVAKADLTGYTYERAFSLSFAGAANEKVDLYFTGAGASVYANIEVTLVGWFGTAPSAGSARAAYSMGGGSTGTLFSNTMDYTLVQGLMPDQFALTPLSWDSANSRWKITIAHRALLADTISVSVRWQTQSSAQTTAIRNSIGVSSVYTTDTTTYAAPVTSSPTRAALVIDDDGHGDYASIAAALTAVGSDEADLVITSSVSLSAAGDTTIPANVRLAVARGGSIALAGYTLTINGRLSADRSTIFTGSGTVILGAGSVEAAFPEWWGAKAEAISVTTPAVDSGPAITKAIAAVKAAGGVVELGSGKYRVSTTINASLIQPLSYEYQNAVCVTVRGKGRYRTYLSGGESGYGFIETIGSNYYVLEGMTMRSTTTLQYGILNGRTTGDGSAGNHEYRDLYIYGAFTLAGIFALSSEVATYDHVGVYTTTGKAVVLAKDIAGYGTPTAKYAPLSTTVPIGGGNGVTQMISCNLLTISPNAGDRLLSVEFPQTFTCTNLYTYTENQDVQVWVSKICHDMTFTSMHQEHGAVEPFGFWINADNATPYSPHFRDISFIGCRMYSIYGEDGASVSGLNFRSLWRGTKTYQLDVDVLWDSSVHCDGHLSTVREIANPAYRVRTPSVDNGNDWGNALTAKVTQGTALYRATGEKVFSCPFTGVANEKLDIFFNGAGASFYGHIEVALTGFFAGADSTGILRASYALGGSSTGTIFGNSMQYTLVQGSIPDSFALSPLSWDATNSRWKITVVHRLAAADNISVAVKWQARAAASADAIRGSLGLTSVYTTDATTYSRPVTSDLVPRVAATSSSATPTPNADTDDEYQVTALAAGATFGAPTGSPSAGKHLLIRVKDNGTARTLAWNSAYRAIGVTMPTTTVVGKLLYVEMVYNATDTKWDVLTVAQEA